MWDPVIIVTRPKAPCVQDHTLWLSFHTGSNCQVGDNGPFEFGLTEGS